MTQFQCLWDGEPLASGDFTRRRLMPEVCVSGILVIERRLMNFNFFRSRIRELSGSHGFGLAELEIHQLTFDDNLAR